MTDEETPSNNTLAEPISVKQEPLDDMQVDKNMLLVVGDVDIRTNTKRKNNKTKLKIKFKNVKQLYYCDNCDFKSIYKGNLTKHIKINHIAPEPILCSIENGQYPKDFKAHLHTFKCNECTYKTIYRKNLILHLDKHKQNFRAAINIRKKYEQEIRNGSKMYECLKCPFVTLKKGHFLRHLTFVHNEKTIERFKCDYCDYNNKYHYALKDHLNKSLKTDLIKCKNCDFQSYYMCEYTKHKRIHKKIKTSHKRIQTCPEREDQSTIFIDGKEFPRKPNSQLIYDRTKTILINTTLKVDWKNIQVKKLQGNNERDQYQCMQCTFTSTQRDSVKFHVERQHTENSVKPYLCLNCDFAAKTKDQVKKHNKLSKSNNLIACKECSFSSHFKCQLKLHLKHHRPHKCLLCGHTFCDTTKLRQHYAEIHSHSVYQCDFCEFNTYKKVLMIEHFNKHAGMENLKCSDCAFSCVNRTILREHIYKEHHSKDVIFIDIK